MARLAYQRKVLLLGLAPGALPLVVAIALLWRSGTSTGAAIAWSLLLAGAWVGVAAWIGERLVRPVQTAANALGALREGDFSLRLRGDDPDDAFGLLAHEINAIGDRLKRERLDELEAGALLTRVMSEIDAAIFAFDERRRLVLANRAAERLLGRPDGAILGAEANELGLERPLDVESGAVLDLVFAGGGGRWEVRGSVFRLEGRPHRLLVLTDLSRVLREEERNAWQRLVRVLSHEINNSLAPIRSIADSLRKRLAGGADGDVEEGLDVIAGRAEALARFLSSYARLARLPPPVLGPVRIREWVERVTRLETRIDVAVEGGPDVTVEADGDQLDQMLINLIDNAADAVAETGGSVAVSWEVRPGAVEVRVEDEGPGLSGTENLFVPFFTTKPDGSGIGLALARHVAEAHGGALMLENRPDGRGCVARVRLPRPG